jgi:hypothetical protein
MTLAVVAIVALNVGIVGALAFLMTHASRWGSYDRPDPFVCTSTDLRLCRAGTQRRP